MRARWGLVFLAVSLLTLTGCPDDGGGDDDTGTSGGDTSIDGGDTGVAPDTQADGGEDTGTDTVGDTGGPDADTSADGGDQKPMISFRELATGDVVTGTVDVSAEASDDEEIDSVALAIDGTEFDTKTEGPYRFAWKTGDYEEKKHTLELTATDSAGQTASASIEVTVDRTGPMISIKTPAENQVFVDKVPVKVDVSDNTSISEVTFVVDSQARTKSVSSMPFETEFDLSMMSRGLHSVAATAVDAAGLEAKDSVVFELGCMEDDHCPGSKVCVDQSCKELMPQCTQAGQTCDPDSRNPAGQGFACKDTGFGPECRTTCTVPASGDPAACPSGSICLGADPGKQGY